MAKKKPVFEVPTLVRARSRDDATAYHEAGHAAMAILVDVRVHRATIVPDRKRGSHGHVLHANAFRRDENVDTLSERLLVKSLRHIKFLLAGEIAQRRRNPRSVRTSHGRSDRSSALDFAENVTGSPKQAEALIRFLAIQTEDALVFHWPEVEAIAKAVLERGTLSEDEIRDAFGTARPELAEGYRQLRATLGKLAEAPTPAWTPPSIPLHESFASAARQRQLGLDKDVVVIAIPTTKRTPGELSTLRAVAKSRGYRWVSEHAELILAQAHDLGLDKEI